VIVGDWKDETRGSVSAMGRLRGGGSDGTSFRMLIIFDRLAGAALGGSTTA
jgi:hypothetical protein